MLLFPSLSGPLGHYLFDLSLKGRIISTPGFDPAPDTNIAAMTDAREEDYEKFKYQCRDRLHLTGEITNRGLNLVQVNERPVKPGDALFLLLLRLAVAAKEEPGGWVNIIALQEEQILHGTESRQSFSRLREKLATGIANGSNDHLIENDGAKHHRISTYPDFIACDPRKLLLHRISACGIWPNGYPGMSSKAAK